MSIISVEDTRNRRPCPRIFESYNFFTQHKSSSNTSTFNCKIRKLFALNLNNSYQSDLHGIFFFSKVKSLSGITKDCQRKYRQKIRDLYDKLARKFGVLTIISLVPTHDGETLTRLKAIKKEQARKARKKLETKKTTQDSHQDETDFTTKRKPKTLVNVSNPFHRLPYFKNSIWLKVIFFILQDK